MSGRHPINDVQKKSWLTGYIVMAAAFYNALLAIINEHVTPLGFNAVAMSEFGILAVALLLILAKGIHTEDFMPLGFLLITLFFAAYVTVINGYMVLDYFRNILVIFCFITLGSWLNLRSIKWIFLLSTAIIFLVLLLEIFDTGAYGDLFHPAMYFYNTRGVELFEIVDSKLFRNALGFEGRFSFGIINHRSSSIFLEQVSLANYCGVMMIFLVALWGRFSFWQRFFLLFTIVLILITNDTRTMLIFGVLSIIGYFVFPRLPRFVLYLYLPAFLFLGFIIYLVDPTAQGDNISGRVVLTMSMFAQMDLPAQLGFAAGLAPTLGDSGYIYVIVIGTVFSFILLWLFVCSYPAFETIEQRRFAHALSLFIFMNMMIGGTAVFSIKIASFMWLLAGYMKFDGKRQELYAGKDSPDQQVAPPPVNGRGAHPT